MDIMRSIHLPAVLVVDDDEGVLTLIRDILQLEKYAVKTACSTGEACALLQKERFSLVILDWVYRNGRKTPNDEPFGTSVVRTCKALESPVPVLAMSGDGLIDAERDSISSGADDFIAKPLSTPDLIKRVSLLANREDDTDWFTHLTEADIQPLDEMERRYVSRVVEILDNNISHAARKLCAHRHTISNILERQRLQSEGTS
jgi:DNA-binding NtrC family response regulator